jgi:hypothetical protein
VVPTGGSPNAPKKVKVERCDNSGQQFRTTLTRQRKRKPITPGSTTRSCEVYVGIYAGGMARLVKRYGPTGSLPNQTGQRERGDLIGDQRPRPCEYREREDQDDCNLVEPAAPGQKVDEWIWPGNDKASCVLFQVVQQLGQRREDSVNVRG